MELEKNEKLIKPLSQWLPAFSRYIQSQVRNQEPASLTPVRCSLCTYGAYELTGNYAEVLRACTSKHMSFKKSHPHNEAIRIQ